MSFSPTLAAHRFGYGLSPTHEPPDSVPVMMSALRGADVAAAQYALPSTESLHMLTSAFRDLRRARQAAMKSGRDTGAEFDAYQAFKQAQRHRFRGWERQTLLRRIRSKDGLRERLVDFWADHFSAPGKNYVFRANGLHYVEDAIRPHVAGRFEDMLVAAVLHPQMLVYLDQTRSVGPNSSFAKSRPDANRGLNENLAREVLELHTLGVDASYGQADVRELAELLTGLRTDFDKRMIFATARAEPGTETVLGRTYGRQGRAGVGDVKAVLRDLARHPDTAAHLARKMAVHYVSDTPDLEMVGAMQRAYLETDGDLSVMTETMLRHPAAWSENRRNFKQPLMFVCSALRGLAVTEAQVETLNAGRMRRFLHGPLRAMGQPMGAPLGPDGFAEGDAHWLSPQGLAARLQWSLGAPSALVDPLPDPRDFVTDVLGDAAPREVQFAAKAAENKREGVALILMSPAFQRM